MDAILSFRRASDDYYSLLGCDELSATEQILAEYKARVRTCHPDKVPDDCAAAAQFVKLQQAKDVLCNESSRHQYDQWRRCGLCLPFEDWQARAAHHASMHWAASKQKDLMIEHGNYHQECQKELSQSGDVGSGRNVQLQQQQEVTWELLRKQFRNYEI